MERKCRVQAAYVAEEAAADRSDRATDRSRIRSCRPNVRMSDGTTITIKDIAIFGIF